MKKSLPLLLLTATLLAGCGTKAEVNTLKPNFDLKMVVEADGSYTVNATVTPSYATNKHITWELAWDTNEASTTDDDAFKDGKNPADYIGLAVAEDTLSVNLTNKAKFGSQIKLNAYVTDNPSVNANLKINYRKKNEVITNRNQKLVVGMTADTSTLITKTYVTDSIGTLPRTEERTIEYKYANYFVWYGGAQVTPVEWTTKITISKAGSYDKDLLTSLGANFATIKTREIPFNVFKILDGPNANYAVVQELAYAWRYDSSVTDFVNKGAKLNIPYRLFLNGTATTTDWLYQEIDLTNVVVQPEALSLSDGEIIF